MLKLASWRNFKAIVISFLGLLLTFVDDMFDGNVALLVEFSLTNSVILVFNVTLLSLIA